MKIAIIAPSPVPFVIGGAERLWWDLLTYLNQQTEHQVELIKLPSPERNFNEVIQSYESFSHLDLQGFDCVISGKYPSWMVQHPNHICYLLHPLRGVYDSYPIGMKKLNEVKLPDTFNSLLSILGKKPDRSQLPDLFHVIKQLKSNTANEPYFDFPGPLTRAIIHHLDKIGLASDKIKQYACISNTVRARNDYFPDNVDVKIVYPPSPLASQTAGRFDYFFTASRLDSPKRIDLLIKAFVSTKLNIKFYIAGTGPQENTLKAIAKNDNRIHFLGFLTDTQLKLYYRDAMLVPFIPFDEDYGLITLEAMTAGKPVLTTSDSGGVAELVTDQLTGMIVHPDVSSIAQAMTRLAIDKPLLEKMGFAANRKASSISWHSFTDLLNPISALINRSKPNHKSILVLSTFPAWPPKGGGQQRLFHLYQHISQMHQVTILSLGSEAHQIQFNPNFAEVCIPYSYAQRVNSGNLYHQIGVDISDIAVIDNIFMNPDYLITLNRLIYDIDLVVCSHPFLYPAVRSCWQGHVAYDAQDVEIDIKSAILSQIDQPQKWLQKVKEAEARCARDSIWQVTCSEQDRNRLIELYNLHPAKVGVAPNGANIKQSRFFNAEERAYNAQKMGIAKPILLFMGSWHGPNIEGAKSLIRWFNKYQHQWQLWLMGTLCDHPDIKDATQDNIYCLGSLTDSEKSAVMSVTSIALNPIDSGSGTNLKMLDYAAHGIDIITTPFGHRGLTLLENDTMISVAAADQFPEAIEYILSLPIETRNQRVSAARNVVENHFDWKACSQPLLKLLSD